MANPRSNTGERDQFTPAPRPTNTGVPADVLASLEPAVPPAVAAADAAPATGAQLVTVDIASLTQLIAGVISAQLANASQLSNVGLADAISAGIAGSTRRRKTFGEYIATVGNYYHPVVKETVYFAPNRRYYQNGAEFMHSNLFDQEVALLNRLTHSGRYLERLLEVSMREQDGIAEFHLNYSNKAAGLNKLKEQLYRQKEDKTTLATMLRMVVDAQEAEDRETAELLEERQAKRVALQDARAAREAVQA